MFDVHLMDSFEKHFNKKDVRKEDEDVEIDKNSYSTNYFIDNIFGIMNIPENDIFTKTFNFKEVFIVKFAVDSLEFNTKLESFKNQYISTLDPKQCFLANTFQFLKWVILCLI